MKIYKYFDKGNRLLAESNTPIKFNTVLFPIFKDIEPVVEDVTVTAKATGTNKTEEKKK